MAKKTMVLDIGADQILAGERVKIPLNLQIENDLHMPIRVYVTPVVVEDIVTLNIEVAECHNKK